MKKLLFLALSVTFLPFVSAQDVTLTKNGAVRVPNGYQAHIEYSNLFYLKDGGTSMDLSTTHGFFYTPNMYVGIGIGFHVSPDDVYVPVFASAKYVFNYRTKISPTLQLRMGSFFNEGAKPYGDISFGLRFASDRDFAFSVQACASYFAPFDYENEHWDYKTNSYIYSTGTENLSSVGLRIGIEW